MATSDTVSTANSILNKGRKPPRRGMTSVEDASKVLTKSSQSTATPNPAVNYATEYPNTNPPDPTIPITDLVYVFEQALEG